MRTRRVTPAMPGWSRVRRGRGFQYVDESGAPLPGAAVERCRALVIPPAWTDVWICPIENGHIQAVGTDDAGRRQYLYHQAWRERRDAEKFTHMELFARALLRQRPVVRRQLSDLPDRQSVAAAAFSLLDLGMFRVGSAQYAEDNDSYGLTTLEKRHVHREGAAMVFAFAAKSGQEIDVAVRDERVIRLLDTLRARRSGDTLLAYKQGGRWRSLTADDVNAHVKETLGADCSAKDFRTWRGTVIAAHALALSDAETAAARRRSITAAMREVGDHLGNTPAVARSAYVDPRVIDLFEQGETVRAGSRSIAPGAPLPRTLERAVLRLLKRV